MNKNSINFLLNQKKAREEFEAKRLANLKAAEEKTAKKRAKRLKNKTKSATKKQNDHKDDHLNDEEEEKEEVIDLDEPIENSNETTQNTATMA